MKKKTTKKKVSKKKKPSTKKKASKKEPRYTEQDLIRVFGFILRTLSDYRAAIIPHGVNPVTVSIEHLDDAIFSCEANLRLLSN